MVRTRKAYSELSDGAKRRQCFRGSVAWKALKGQVAHLQNNKCFVSGRPLTNRANLHHLDLDLDHYEQIDDISRFVYLSADIHDAVHTLYKCPVGWRKALGNMAAVMQRMDELNGLVDGKPVKDKSK